MLARLAAAAIVLIAAAPTWAAADPARYMPAELIAESAAPRPGSTILVGFQMTPRPGWHGYWSNPGDSGIAPSVAWKAPAGVTFSRLLHPAPSLITAEGISSFVHDGPHILLSRMTIPRSLAPGTAIPITAQLNWAACTATQCVPLRATLSIELVVGTGAQGRDAPALRAAAAKLPRNAPAGSFTSDGKSLRLLLPASLRLDPRTTRFFPDDSARFATASARAGKAEGTIAITAPMTGEAADSIAGVATDGRAAYRLVFRRAAIAAAAAPQRAEEADDSPAAQPAAAPPPITSQPVRSAAERKPADDDRRWMLAIAAMFLAAAALLLARRSRRHRPRS
jgi:DsbC/DsbD-like thiol-disulfide interchange protein